MKVLHILLEEIKYDARVKKEISTIKAIRNDKLELIYYSYDNPFCIYSDNDIVIRPPNIRNFLKKITPLYFAIKVVNIIYKLFSLLCKKKFDLIHVHNNIAFTIVMCIKWITINKNTYTVYDTHELFSGIKTRFLFLDIFYKLVDPIVLKKADFVIHANESRMQYCIKKFDGNPLTNIYVNNYFDLNDIIQYTSMQIFDDMKKGGKKIVIYQGVVYADRLIFDLVKNFDKGKDDKIFVIIGDGPDLNRIRSYINQNHLEHKILTFGRKPHEELKNYTAYGDLGIVSYANTCLNNYYCASNKISEYVASKVPILGVDLPEVRKIIDKFEIGFLFKEEEICNFGNIVDEILSRYPAGINSDVYDQFFKQINWKNESQKIIDLYNKVAKQLNPT